MHAVCDSVCVQSLEAQEVWLTVDILDPVTQACEWAEVGRLSVSKPGSQLLVYI